MPASSTPWAEAVWRKGSLKRLPLQGKLNEEDVKLYEMAYILFVSALPLTAQITTFWRERLRRGPSWPPSWTRVC